MKNFNQVSFFLTIVLFILINCNAPRNNPLDSKNPENPFTTLQGTVEEMSGTPLEGVKIYWQNDDIIVNTNSKGQFGFEYISKEDGWITFEKEGFHTDSLLIIWGTQKIVSIELTMNALPILENLEVYSSVLNIHPTDKEFHFMIEAIVDDPDNEIDTVFWEVPNFNLKGHLDPQGTKFYQHSFKPELQNEEIVGHDFIITVQDLSGKKTIVGNKQVKRVIKKDLIGLSPSGGIQVSSMPNLEWSRFLPGFSHSYRLEVYKDVQFSQPELAWVVENLSYTLTNYTVDQELEPLDEPDVYFWVIWAIDEFQNRARSKPLTFSVISMSETNE